MNGKIVKLNSTDIDSLISHEMHLAEMERIEAEIDLLAELESYIFDINHSFSHDPEK